MTLWAHKITFAKWSVSGRGTLRPSWMVAIAEGGEKWEPDSLVTKGITELSIEWMESSETPLMSKVSRAYPQILTEHLLVARWTPGAISWPGSPTSEPLSMDLISSDNSSSDVTLGFLHMSFKVLIHRSPQRAVVNLIPCQKRGWQARLLFSNHTQKTQKSKLLPDIQLKSV